MRKMSCCALLCAALLLISACGPSATPTPAGPVSIEVWTYYNGPQKGAFDKLVAQFNQTVGAEEGIVVEAYSQGQVNELAQKVQDAAARRVGAPELPDIFAAYADHVLPLLEQDLLLDLDTAITAEQQAAYIPSYLQEGRLPGWGLMLFPTAKSTEITLLNATDWAPFAAATGVSTDGFATYEGIVQLSADYYSWTDAQTDAPNDGKALFGLDVPANYLLVGASQLGHPLLLQAEDGSVQVVLDRATLRQLWDHYYVPTVNGWFTAHGRFRSDDAKTGLVLAYQGSSASASFFPSAVTVDDGVTSHEVEPLVFPAPVFEQGRAVAVQQGAGMAVVKSTAAQEKAAVRFLLWLSEGDNAINFGATSGYLPVTQQAGQPAAFQAALDAMGDELDPRLARSLPVALEQMTAAEHFFPPCFDQGAGLRRLLDSSIAEVAQAAVAEVEAALAADSTLTRATAAATLTGDEAFEQWYQALETAVTDLGATLVPAAV